MDTRHIKRKQDRNSALESVISKNPRVTPSILKVVSTPRKPRVGDDFQAILPFPSQSIPQTQSRSEPLPPLRPSSAATTAATTTTTDEQTQQQQ